MSYVYFCFRNSALEAFDKSGLLKLSQCPPGNIHIPTAPNFCPKQHVPDLPAVKGGLVQPDRRSQTPKACVAKQTGRDMGRNGCNGFAIGNGYAGIQ